MNFCGIICEFNPFHNGHEYLIQQAKKITNEEIICLMSGCFVQRGNPAIESKYERAKKAVMAGASAVFELPTIYACSNAENFANGAINTLTALGAKHIAFGIEKTNLETLWKIAKLKFENSEKFQNTFKNEIENGINYNTALKRSIALNLKEKNITEILNKPNNILAIEYLTAILKQKSKIKPIAIERVDDGYNSKTTIGQYASATALREMLQKNANINKFIPNYAQINNFFDNNCEKKIETLIKNEIINQSPEKLNQFYDYNEGIEYRIKKCVLENYDLKTIIKNISTPRYRETRVCKLLLYPLLNVTKKVIKISQKTKPVAKVLVIKNKQILSIINKNKISLIATNKDYEKLNRNQKQIIKIDLKASQVYNLATNQNINNDKIVGTIFM